MNKKLLYLATLLMMLLGMNACSYDKAIPPVFYPEQVGDGTGLSPYSVGTALTKIYTGDYGTKQVFVKGIVSQVTEFGASYGNITYYISDDGKTANELEVYRGLGLNGEKFTAISDLSVGDEVIIACTLTYYNDKYPETGQGAIIVSLNGSPWTPDPVVEPTGTGVKEDPFNVTKALEVILGENCPTEKVYVSGVISKVESIDTSFGNAVYYISDTGSTFTQLEIYRGYSLGGAKFKSTDEIKVGDEVTVYGQVVNFNGTPEFTTGSMITVLNGVEEDPNKGGATSEPAGEGTKDSPYNVAKAQQVIASLAADTPTEKVYVEGIVSSVTEISTSFGNGTFSISDDGTAAGELLIYRSYYLNGDKFTSADQVKVGDKVVVLGQLINFKGNTPEMTQGGQIVSIEGNDTPGPTPSGDNSLDNPYTVAKAQEIIASGSYTTDKVYISGTISQIDEVSLQYGNAGYYISDNGTTAGQLQVFRGYYLNGDKFTSEDQIKVGDKVVILGALTSYNGKPQVNTGSQIVTLNGQGGNTDPTPDPDPDPTPVTGNSADFNTFNGGVANTMAYATYKTAQGWVADWSLILAGGTDATNFVSSDSKFLFPCLDGTTARPGKLTSPTISGGLKKLTFKYGFPYNETKAKFTVNILQGGSVVDSESVTLDSVTKGVALTFTKTYSVSGDFVIQIINDLYSATSTGNKDRVAIWDLTWEN